MSAHGKRFRFKRRIEHNFDLPACAEYSAIDFDLAVDVFKDEYMRDDWSTRTLSFHLENLSVFRKYIETQGMTLGQVTPGVLDQFVKNMRSAGKKKNTINGRVKTLRVFYRILHKKGYVPQNHAFSLDTIEGPETDIIPFTSEQVKALLSKPERSTFVGLRDYMIMEILLDTGIRLDEMCNAKVSDIDTKGCSLYVRLGKGRKSRTVFFGAETRKSVIKYLSVTGIVKDGEQNLILNQDGGPLKPRSVQERISIYAEAAGIRGVRPSPHTFRHTFAKMYLMNGGDPYALRDLLGHNTMTTVIRYLKLFREDLRVKYRGKSPVDRLS